MIGLKWSLLLFWFLMFLFVLVNNCLLVFWNGLKFFFFWVKKNVLFFLGFRDENVSWLIEEDFLNICEVGKYWFGFELLFWNLGIVFFVLFFFFDIIGFFDFL